MASPQRRLLSAKRLCSGRSRRREEFPEDLFADWAWSMLLLTYIARGEGRSETTAELAATAGVSPAVGQRWISYLLKEEMIAVEGGTVALTAGAAERLDRYLDIVVDIAAGQTAI